MIAQTLYIKNTGLLQGLFAECKYLVHEHHDWFVVTKLGRFFVVGNMYRCERTDAHLDQCFVLVSQPLRITHDVSLPSRPQLTTFHKSKLPSRSVSAV
jgi:hypothetical protein